MSGSIIEVLRKRNVRGPLCESVESNSSKSGDSQAAGSQAAGSQATGSQAAGSQAAGSQSKFQNARELTLEEFIANVGKRVLEGAVVTRCCGCNEHFVFLSEDAVCPACGSDDLEDVGEVALEPGDGSEPLLEVRMVWAIRGGEKTKVKLRKKGVRRRRLTAAQKSALRKARKFAHTAGARRARMKSMRKHRLMLNSADSGETENLSLQERLSLAKYLKEFNASPEVMEAFRNRDYSVVEAFLESRAPDSGAR